MARSDLSRSDGYTLIDIDDAPVVVGPVRSARKVLPRTTTDLVRHATYALAAFGITGSGGAAALNLDPSADDRAAKLDVFVDELIEWAGAANFRATAGLGIDIDLLTPIVGRPAPPTSRQLVAASAVASMHELDIGPVVIASESEESELMRALEDAGEIDIERIDDLQAAMAVESRATFVRCSTGGLSHVTLAETNAGQIIGLQPLTTTARGRAFAARQGSVVLPDFVTAAGPYLAATSDISDPDALLADVSSRASEVATRTREAGVDTFVAACEAAESHLRTWTDTLPFGRPLAP